MIWNIVLAQQEVFSNPKLPESNTLLFNLISSPRIAELTQAATEIAAQTFRSNGEYLSNSGAEVRPVTLDARPSEIFGQSLTNFMSPARQNIAKALKGQPFLESERLPIREDSSYNAGTSLIEQLANSFLGRRTHGEVASITPKTENNQNLMQMNGMVNQAMQLLSGGEKIDNAANADNGRMKSTNFLTPTLKQIFPDADRNFGFRQGEGCVPFLGEFMKMAYGNCVKQADEKTWDTWGKEINSALMGGKIDLLRASKETCKMGAEREHCAQLRKSISECNILGSISLASNLQRSISRCDEVTGLIDQNPTTMLNQMNGLINGEMAQGLLNNFLG